MNLIRQFREGLAAPEPSVKFSPFGIDNLPPEMREGMGFGGWLAPKVGRAVALQVPAVLRSRNLICTLATLPHQLRSKERRIVTGTDAPTTLFDQIHPDLPNVVTYAATYEDLFFEQISWWHVLERNFAGWPTYAEHVEPYAVHVSADGSVWLNGQRVAEEDMIRFDGPNPALLVHAARAIRTCLVLDQTAANYADEPMPLGYFTPKEGTRPNEDPGVIQGILDKWAAARRNRATGYVPSTLELKVAQFNAEQIQLKDQRQHAVLEIARAAGVDPEDLGVSTTSRTYQNAEQRRMDMLDFTHAAYRSAMEQRLSMHDVTPRGYELKVNLDGFLRGDTKARMETYAIGEPLGLYPPERLAELEDIPRVVKPKPVLPNVSSIGDNASNGRATEGAVDGRA